MPVFISALPSAKNIFTSVSRLKWFLRDRAWANSAVCPGLGERRPGPVGPVLGRDFLEIGEIAGIGESLGYIGGAVGAVPILRRTRLVVHRRRGRERDDLAPLRGERLLYRARAVAARGARRRERHAQRLPAPAVVHLVPAVNRLVARRLAGVGVAVELIGAVVVAEIDLSLGG